MEANDYPEEDLIIAAALEILAGGLLTFDVVIDGLYERGLLSHLADLDEEALFDEVYEIFSMTDALWDSDNLVASTAQLLDGITFTHLVSADELERGMVEATPDLDIIGNGMGMDQALPLLSGGTCGLVFPRKDPAAHPEGSYAGPPGWLDALPGPGLAVFRRSGGNLVVAPVSELSDDTAELNALRVALAECTDPGIGFEPLSMFMELLIVHPHLFRTPVRPIAVLLDELGFERRGAWFGLRSTEWITPGQRYQDDLAQQIAERWEFETCCRQAFDVVRSAWQESLEGAVPDQPTKRAVSRALLHEPVSQAFASYVLRGWGRRSPGLTAFANELLDQPESLQAPAHYLLALCAERDGDARAAEAHLSNAVLVEPDYSAALEEYAWYAADRGDAARACSLLMQAGAGPGVHEYDYLAEQVERSKGGKGGTGSTAKVGRNDPCPCGSGKRFKQCCINGATVPIERRSGWLCNKMERFALRPFHSAGVEAQAAIFEQMGVDLPQSMIPMLLDLIASDPDMVQEFIDQRGYLLPADELVLLQQWQGIRLELYEVVDVDPGASMTVRDTRSGVEVLVTERTATLELAPHGYVLTRIAPVGSEYQIIGAVMPVTMFQRDSVLRMLDDGYTTEDMTWWLASICRPPTMQNREGDDLVMCSLTLRPMLMGWDKLPAALDELFGPAEGEVWRDLLDPDGESFVRALLTREGQNLVVETNSIRRAEDVQERLTHIGGAAFEVIDSVQTPLEELAKQAKSAELSGPDGSDGPDGPSSGPKRSWSSSDDPADMPDEIRQLVEKMIHDQEEKWVDGPVPALGGLTPRQALDDPTRREDLLALLSEFDRRGAGQPAGTTFDVDRIRGLLGLA